MGFDKAKVQFSDIELEGGRAIDEIYEEAVKRFGDGVEYKDFLSVLLEVWDEREELQAYFDGADTKEEIGKRLANLGFMMVRDNIF